MRCPWPESRRTRYVLASEVAFEHDPVVIDEHHADGGEGQGG
jgi:hypothetical protein